MSQLCLDGADGALRVRRPGLAKFPDGNVRVNQFQDEYGRGGSQGDGGGSYPLFGGFDSRPRNPYSDIERPADDARRFSPLNARDASRFRVAHVCGADD